MSNKQGVNFGSLIDATSQMLLAEFAHSAASKRPDQKGAPREEQIRKFLRKTLPAQFGIAKAHVIYKGSLTSLEFDIVVYDHQKTPRWPCEKGKDPRLLIPLEMVLGIIEVKSTLDEGALTSAREKIKEFDEILAESPNKSDYQPFRHLFAYKLKDGENFQGYGSAAAFCTKYASPISTQPDGIFVLEKEFSVLDTQEQMVRCFSIETGQSAQDTLEGNPALHNEVIQSDLESDPSYMRDYVTKEAPGGRALVAMLAFITERAAKFEDSGFHAADAITGWLRK